MKSPNERIKVTRFVTFVNESAQFEIPPLTMLLISKRGHQLWFEEDDYRQDFFYFLDQLSSISSPNSLLSALLTSLWMYLNVRSCEVISPKKFKELTTRFISEYLEQYKLACDDYLKEYESMTEPLRNFLKTLSTNANLELSQSKIPAFEQKDDVALAEELSAKAYIAHAKMLEPMLNNLLRQQIDSKAKTGIKPLSRAIFKANREYFRDVSKILDYLRASVDISIEKSDTLESIREIYNSAIAPISEFIVKTTVFLGSADNPEPHALLILNFKDFLCELKLGFRFFEIKDASMDTFRMLCRMKSKHLYRLHAKEHVLEIISDEIERLNFHLDSYSSLLPDANFRVTALPDGGLCKAELRNNKSVIEERIYRVLEKFERVR
jgi:hypothetical protein